MRHTHIGLDGVSFSYPDGHRVLTDVSFAVPAGSVTPRGGGHVLRNTETDKTEVDD